MKKINALQVVPFIFLFIFSITSIHAQDDDTPKKEEKSPVKMGIKAGYSLGKLSNSDDNIYTQNYESISGIDFGVQFEFPIDKTLSIQAEINYTQRGGKRVGLQPVTGNELSEQLNQFLPFIGMPLITDENPLYATFDSESDLNYLEFPVLAKFGWGKSKTRVYAEVGPYVGILISAKQKTSGTSQFTFDSNGANPVIVPNPAGNPPFVQLPAQSLDADTDIKDDLHIVNFGGIFGVGVTQKFNEKSEVFLDARTSYSFTSIQIKDTYGQSNVGGIIFSLGYSFAL